MRVQEAMALAEEEEVTLMELGAMPFASARVDAGVE